MDRFQAVLNEMKVRREFANSLIILDGITSFGYKGFTVSRVTEELVSSPVWRARYILHKVYHGDGPTCGRSAWMVIYPTPEDGSPARTEIIFGTPAEVLIWAVPYSI